MNSIRGMAYWHTCGRRYELELNGEVCLAEITKDGKKINPRPEDKVIIRHVISELRSGEHGFYCTSCSLYDEEIHTFPKNENIVHFIPESELTCYKIDSILSKSFLNSIQKRVEEKPKRYDIWEDETLRTDEKFDEWFLEWTLGIQKLIKDMNSGILDAINEAEFQECMKKIKFNKRIRKLKYCEAVTRRLLSVVLAISLLYLILPKEIKFKSEYSLNRFLDRTCGFDYCSINKSNISIEDIRNALANNPYFSEEDKTLFGNLWKIIEENREFINLSEIVKNISEFQFVPSERLSYLDKNAIAGYVSAGFNKNTIYIFDVYEDYNKAQQNSIKLHEVGHGLTDHLLFADLCAPFDLIFNIFDSASSLRISLLDELVNELFARDYCSYLNGDEPTFDNFIGYNLNVPACYALCEIVRSETMREYKFTRDLSLLVETLSSIDGDVTRAYKFLQLFDELDVAMYYENKEKEEELRFVIGQELSYYYEARFNRHIYDDVYMCLYLYNTGYGSPRMDETLKKFFESETLDFKISSLKKYLAHEGNDYSIIEANGRTYIVNEENRYMNDIQKVWDEKVMAIKPISN